MKLLLFPLIIFLPCPLHRLMRHFMCLDEQWTFVVGDDLDGDGGVALLGLDALMDEVGVGRFFRGCFVVVLDVGSVG